MNNNDQDHPWLCWDDAEVGGALFGNRVGFEKLRDSIDRLLEQGDGRVAVNQDGLGFNELILRDKPDSVEPTGFSSVLISILFVLLVLSMPFLALYGLFSLIKTIF